ncbi:MAG: SPOR domain-containing protein [Candidatus Marinimicrobia bacterium]|nr:SPOR domain-containing protein [Candidatus Neomarinimicrobiota bacterium]
MKRYIKPYILVLVLFLMGNSSILSAENILKILEGYGQDSIATFSTQGARAEAAKVFNLILESDGKITAEKAEQYLSSEKSNIMKAYLSVMLADYAFVNNAYDSGLRYLKRAVDEHDPIRNDSYYRLVLSRAQKSIVESPGKTNERKESVLEEFNPTAIIADPVVKKVKLDTIPETPENFPAPKAVEPETKPTAENIANFRIQVGAFSVQENAHKKQSYFEERGFPVQVEMRERTSGYLYLIRIGAYASYDEAKRALSELKIKYPSEDGIVIKVEK